MICRSKILLTAFLMLFCSGMRSQPSGNKLLDKGWSALVKDDDVTAFRYFFKAYEQSKKDDNTEQQAQSMLYLGICTFGTSLEKGLQYATKSLYAYRKLETAKPLTARVGRSKCLQLISTIYTRQRKYKEAMQMSKEVADVLKDETDKSGTLGLAYSTIGSLYEMRKQQDSAAYFYALALKDFQRFHNYAYLPGAYVKNALVNRDDRTTLVLLQKGLAIADSTQNKQARVDCLVALGSWFLSKKDALEAEYYFVHASQIATSLSDKIFEIKSLGALIELRKFQNNYSEAVALQEKRIKIKDVFYSLEREQIVKSLEVQFEVSEKDRKLELLSKARKVSRFANFLLVACIAVLIVIFIVGYFFLKGINKRDRQLLKAKEDLVDALEKQKMLKEAQFQNDIEHKESQLSAITLQMLQKNELLGEIKLAIEKKEPLSEGQLLKMVDRHFTQDNSWTDFDMYFESINKNFYSRLKSHAPGISANDLKICALIKLNLSIKEMASILNISPDSVKTARYRLRKKLRLNTEDSLTDFILSI